MARLADVVAAGGQCVWAGVQRRPLVPLTGATCQGAGERPAADVLVAVARKEAPEGAGRLTYVPVGVSGAIRMGRGR